MFFADSLYIIHYYETEIDLKQIDPTIQNINKFIDTYETIEISNIDNFSITNIATKINMYKYKDIELFSGIEVNVILI